MIAFRGTDPIGLNTHFLRDLASDVSMAFGNFTKQMEYAIRFIQKALNNIGVSAENITITGHSVGGSLAEIAGYTFGCETYTYNAFSVRDTIDSDGYAEMLSDFQLDPIKNESIINNIIAFGPEDPDDNCREFDGPLDYPFRYELENSGIDKQ